MFMATGIVLDGRHDASEEFCGRFTRLGGLVRLGSPWAVDPDRSPPIEDLRNTKTAKRIRLYPGAFALVAWRSVKAPMSLSS